MRTNFLCISVLRVASGPRVKLTSCKSALNPPDVYSTDRFKAVFLVFFLLFVKQKVKGRSRECHNHKPQPFPDPKRKRKPTNPNKHKSNKRTKSTKISPLTHKRGNRNTKRTRQHKNKRTHGKTSPRRINHKAKKSKTNTGTTALERSVEQTSGGGGGGGGLKHFYS